MTKAIERQPIVADVQNVIWIEDAAVQTMVCASDIGTLTVDNYEFREKGNAVEIIQTATKMDNKILFDLLPWLQVVRQKYDFFNLERQLIFDETLQDDVVTNFH
ncbi:hypothetical protein HA402_005747 [Bradysia odoriphaga]|nr:hypothetical protein HA402_005747 [Bradysia odoriphaga]